MQCRNLVHCMDCRRSTAAQFVLDLASIAPFSVFQCIAQVVVALLLSVALGQKLQPPSTAALMHERIHGFTISNQPDDEGYNGTRGDPLALTNSPQV